MSRPATLLDSAATVPRRPVPLGKFGRTWVPLDDPDVARYFSHSLFVPHGVRQRWTWAAEGWLGSAAERLTRTASLTAILHAAPTGSGVGETIQLAPGMPGLEVRRLAAEASVLYALLDDLGGALPGGSERAPRWLLVQDYGQGERLLCMLFTDGEQPSAILKIRPATEPSSLRHEWQSLERLCRSLPAALAGTLPQPLAFGSRDRFEGLLLSGLAGRPAYVAAQASWRPLAAAAAHCSAAAAWLAAFHQATPAPGPPVRPLAALRERVEEAVAGGDRAWLGRLAALDEAPPPPSAAVHGDFWARNLLMRPAPSLPAVVDWEAAAAAGSCTSDLFHFAVTYALGFPWGRWRRLAPRLALRKGLLEDNGLSRALRGYLDEYCRRTALDRRRLADWFAIFLLERVAAAAVAAPDPTALEPWLGFLEEFTWTDRSVFSG